MLISHPVDRVSTVRGRQVALAYVRGPEGIIVFLAERID